MSIETKNNVVNDKSRDIKSSRRSQLKAKHLHPQKKITLSLDSEKPVLAVKWGTKRTMTARIQRRRHS